MHDSQLMSIELRERLLIVLIENGKRIIESKFGVNAAESTFFEIVDLIRANPDLKVVFLRVAEKTFLQRDGWGLTAGDVPRELIELVAHEFRWSELQEFANHRINSLFSNKRELAIGDIAVSVLNAFNDNWADREYYSRYRL